MLKRTICFCYIVFASFNINISSGSVGSAEDKKDLKIDAAAIYTQNCAICHGDNGDGKTAAESGLRPPPRDFTTIEAALELTRERMINSVTNGRPGTGMMAHKDRLSPRQIAAVVDYIRQNFMRTPTADDSAQYIKNKHGKEIFTRNCAVCHGDKGNTAVWARNGLNPPPRDFTTDEAKRILTRDRMIHSVTNGRPGTGMMSFTTKLSSKDIESVVDYVREAFMHVDKNNNPLPQPGISEPLQLPKGPYANKPTMPMDKAHSGFAHNRNPHAGLAQRTNPHAGLPGNMMPPMPGGTEKAVDMSLPFPNGLKGDPIKGREFFMHNCFTCHGVTGEGNGPRASFNIPRPRNFTSDDSRRILNRVRLFKGITNGRVGTVMPAWGKVLTDQQIANVGEFVFRAFVRPQDYPEISGFKKALDDQGSAAKKKAL
jgi:mono/diheme cytochrome c family protein